MPPGKPLQQRLQMKVGELFRRWLSDLDTQRALSDSLRRIRDDITPDPATPAPHQGARPAPGPQRTTEHRAVSPCGIPVWASFVTSQRASPLTSRGSPVTEERGRASKSRRGHFRVTGAGRRGHGSADVTVRSKVEVYMRRRGQSSQG